MTGPEIRRMTLDDLYLCVDLFSLVGWGNTADDVRRMLYYEPERCFFARLGGIDVGKVASTRYGRSGWVGNLIVRPEYRSRGIGTSLMKAAIGYLLDGSATSVHLDSVPKTVPLYKRLGFRKEYPSLRFMGLGIRLPWNGVDRMIQRDLPEVVELDERFFGASRERILRRVLYDFPDLCFVTRSDFKIVG